MSYTRLEADEQPQGRRLVLTGLWRVAGLAAWAVINVALLIAEQLAELLAPLLILSGAIWWAVPRALDALRLDGAANDVLQQVRAHVPLEFVFAGILYTAQTLVTDGLLCIAVVAVCRTLSSLLATLLLERP